MKIDVEKEWDNYWIGKRGKAGWYDSVAKIYRKLIIRRALNHFIQKEFRQNSKLLHTGCGTGQVDTDISTKFQITGLDISKEALRLYKKTNGKKASVVQGDVMKMPVSPSSYDGVYNLGLMEHFSKEENEKILKEFRRILGANGKIVLFWPPVFGISVIFLNFLHFILNKILRRNIRLHPEEVSLIRSKTQVNKLLRKSGFKMTQFYFGPKDFFTHCIIVAIPLTNKKSPPTMRQTL